MTQYERETEEDKDNKNVYISDKGNNRQYEQDSFDNNYSGNRTNSELDNITYEREQEMKTNNMETPDKNNDEEVSIFITYKHMETVKKDNKHVSE